MTASLSLFTALQHCFQTAALALLDLGRLVALMARSRTTLSAENLFLRKQLAFFQERKVKPSRADDSTRWMMAALSCLFLFDQVFTPVTGSPRRNSASRCYKGIVQSGNPCSVSSQDGSAKAGSRLKLLLAQ
jgi:hypothetical protein